MEPPQDDRLPHAQHPRRSVRPPHAAGAVIVLAADHGVSHDTLRGVLVHGHCGALDKHREPVPMIVPAAQPLLLGQGQVGLLQMGLTAFLPLTAFRLSVALALCKGCRLLPKRPRLIPLLKTGRLETIELANLFDPAEPPPLALRPTPGRLEKIPPYRRPTKGQNQPVTVQGQAFIGTGAVAHPHNLSEVLAQRGTMSLGNVSPTTRGHTVIHH